MHTDVSYDTNACGRSKDCLRSAGGQCSLTCGGRRARCRCCCCCCCCARQQLGSLSLAHLSTRPHTHLRSNALRRIGGADPQLGLRAAAELLEARAERARRAVEEVAAAAAAAASSGQQPLQQHYAYYEQQQQRHYNPLVEYVFPETARLARQQQQQQWQWQQQQQRAPPDAFAGAAAAAAAGAQELLARASEAARAAAAAASAAAPPMPPAPSPPEELLRDAQAAAQQQAERLAAAAAGGASAAAGAVEAAAAAAARAAADAQAAAAAAAAAAEEQIGEWPSGHDDAGLLRAEEERPLPPRQQQQPARTAASDASAAGATAAAAEASATTAAAAAQPPFPAAAAAAASEPPRPVLRERRVPSTPFGRALGFAGMGASLLLGTLKDNIVGSLTGGSGSSSSGGSSSGGSGSSTANGDGSGGRPAAAFNVITEANAERLAAALCRMRGAALKLGQMLSIQDESVLPPAVQSALERVRQGADVMPRAQLEAQLRAQLGSDWASKLEHFEWQPRAAASIGQVHAAVLKDGRRVAMKVQYPGVARSIESDVDNLMRLIAVANVLPRGLFVENAARVAKRELRLECDYAYEARAQARFKRLVEADARAGALGGGGGGGFHVPAVIDSLCAPQVLTSEWVGGVAIDKVRELDQATRDDVGTRLLRLTLRELFAWRFMQTDPNWGNFLYDPATGVLNLIDFGAAR